MGDEAQEEAALRAGQRGQPNPSPSHAEAYRRGLGQHSNAEIGLQGGGVIAVMAVLLALLMLIALAIVWFIVAFASAMFFAWLLSRKSEHSFVKVFALLAGCQLLAAGALYGVTHYVGAASLRPLIAAGATGSMLIVSGFMAQSALSLRTNPMVLAAMNTVIVLTSAYSIYQAENADLTNRIAPGAITRQVDPEQRLLGDTGPKTFFRWLFALPPEVDKRPFRERLRGGCFSPRNCGEDAVPPCGYLCSSRCHFGAYACGQACRECGGGQLPSPNASFTPSTASGT